MISLLIFLELEVTEAGKNCLDVGATSLGIAEQCREAAKVLGYTYSGVVDWSYYDGRILTEGCILSVLQWNNNSVYWNDPQLPTDERDNGYKEICSYHGKYTSRHGNDLLACDSPHIYNLVNYIYVTLGSMTDVPTTDFPQTAIPTSLAPETHAPTTRAPTTAIPTTHVQTSATPINTATARATPTTPSSPIVTPTTAEEGTNKNLISLSLYFIVYRIPYAMYAKY